MTKLKPEEGWVDKQGITWYSEGYIDSTKIIAKFEERQRIIKMGGKLIKELQEARRLGKEEGKYKEITKWAHRGIVILDDDAEIIDAEGFWKELLKEVK